jgi:transcriptional regulator with XRE-family HTH domain
VGRSAARAEPSPRSSPFAVWLRATRPAAGTQGDLARKIGVAPGTVGRWERGDMAPRPGLRHKLARALGVEVHEIDLLIEGTSDGGVEGDEVGVVIPLARPDDPPHEAHAPNRLVSLLYDGLEGGNARYESWMEAFRWLAAIEGVDPPA